MKADYLQIFCLQLPIANKIAFKNYTLKLWPFFLWHEPEEQNLLLKAVGQ